MTSLREGEGGEAAALLFGLGRAQAAMDQPQEAVANLTRAFDYFEQVGDVSQAVAVAECPIVALPGVTGLVQLIGRALALVPTDSLDAGRLLSRHVRPLVVEQGDYEGAQKASTAALAIARREKDTALEMRTLAESADVDGHNLRLQEAQNKSLQVIELAEEVGVPHAESLARYWAATTLRITGDFEGSGLHAAAGLALADRLRDRFRLATSLLANGELARLKGDWGAAHDFGDRGLAVAPREEIFPALRVLLEHEVGNFQQGEASMKRLLGIVQQAEPEPTLIYLYGALTIPVVSRITGATDHLDIAQAPFERVLSSPHATPLVTMTARGGLALIAVQRRDVEAAGEQYAALESTRGLLLSHMAGDRLLGVLANTIGGRLDQSIAHFEDALVFCRRAGCRPELAWTYYDYADALLQRGGPDDREKAMSLLDESLKNSRDLGMKPLMEHVLNRQDNLKASLAKN